MPVDRQFDSTSDDLIASLAHVHRLVMSGHSLESAIANAVLNQPSRELTALYEQMARGDDVASACRSLAQSESGGKRPTHRDRDSAITLHVLSLAGSIGGRVADQLDSLIDILSDRAFLRGERRTQAASASASIRLLTWLPLVCGAWILLDSADVRSFLLGSINGWICLVSGIVLNLLGRTWMHRMVSAC